MNIIIRVLVVAAIAYGLANLIPGVHINTYGTAVLVAIVLGLLDFFFQTYTYSFNPADHYSYTGFVFAGYKYADHYT